MKNKNKSKEEQETYTRKQLFWMTVVIVVYFFYMKSYDIILLFPTWINYLVFSLTLLTICVIKRDMLLYKLRKANDMMSVASFALEFTGFIIISHFLSGIALIPLNYTNIYLSKQNETTYVDCEITGVSTFSKNNTIFYTFKGQGKVLYAYRPIMDEIEEKRNWKDYLFVAEVREGLMDTYILVSWDIKKK